MVYQTGKYYMLRNNKVKLIDIMQWGEWARVEFDGGSFTEIPMHELKEYN